MKTIQIKRVYDEPAADDGYRVLVDRIWPRGVTKAKANLDEWIKELGPSTDLRKWFGHKPELFEEFSRRYEEELLSKADELDKLRKIAEARPVSLIYSAKDQKANQAVVLRNVLMKKL